MCAPPGCAGTACSTKMVKMVLGRYRSFDHIACLRRGLSHLEHSRPPGPSERESIVRAKWPRGSALVSSWWKPALGIDGGWEGIGSRIIWRWKGLVGRHFRPGYGALVIYDLLVLEGARSWGVGRSQELRKKILYDGSSWLDSPHLPLHAIPSYLVRINF